MLEYFLNGRTRALLDVMDGRVRLSVAVTTLDEGCSLEVSCLLTKLPPKFLTTNHVQFLIFNTVTNGLEWFFSKLWMLHRAMAH
jgi:hypothetical protein